MGLILAKLWNLFGNEGKDFKITYVWIINETFHFCFKIKETTLYSNPIKNLFVVFKYLHTCLAL